MEHIHTTAATVSRLKKRAKIHAQRVGVKHTDALDAVAQEDKYLHWRHVLTCAENSGGTNVLSRPTVEAAYGSTYWRSPSGSITFVVGRSGTGKTVHAHHLLLDAVAAERACCVIDWGRSYENMAKLVGGTCVYLTEDGQHETKKHGDTRFLVIDLERLHYRPWGRQLDDLLTEHEFEAVVDERPSVLVVDELHSIDSSFAETLPATIAGLLAGGAQAVLLSQDSWESELLKPFLRIPAFQRAVELGPPGFTKVRLFPTWPHEPQSNLSVRATSL